MKTFFARACCLTLFIILRVAAISAPEPTLIPKQLNAYIGGFDGLSYKVELRDGVLSYTVFTSLLSNPKATATMMPTATQWHEFRQILDDLKIWQWRDDYPNKTVRDGTQWSLEITYADKALKTKGDNNYPDDVGKPNGKPERTETFNRYLLGVKKLLGGKNFE